MKIHMSNNCYKILMIECSTVLLILFAALHCNPQCIFAQTVDVQSPSDFTDEGYDSQLGHYYLYREDGLYLKFANCKFYTDPVDGNTYLMPADDSTNASVLEKRLLNEPSADTLSKPTHWVIMGGAINSLNLNSIVLKAVSAPTVTITVNGYKETHFPPTPPDVTETFTITDTAQEYGRDSSTPHFLNFNSLTFIEIVSTELFCFSSVTFIESPTSVKLTSLETVPGNQRVLLVWETSDESDNLGFNIYRSESEKGEYIQINDYLIFSDAGMGYGSTYEFDDVELENRKTYYYKLEDVDINGVRKLHGPISAVPRRIYRILK